MEPLVVSVPECRRLLGDISQATVYRFFEDGKLVKRKIGGRTVVTMASIKELVG